jgi:hypothetical protein
MQDADCITAPNRSAMNDLFDAIIKQGAQVAGAVFLCRGGDKINAEPARPGEVYEGDVGTGLMLINCKTAASTPQPWFVHEFSDDGTKTVCGEDIYFCRHMRKHGARVVVDYTMETGHVTEYTLPIKQDLYANAGG